MERLAASFEILAKIIIQKKLFAEIDRFFVISPIFVYVLVIIINRFTFTCYHGIFMI